MTAHFTPAATEDQDVDALEIGIKEESQIENFRD
jgi:hypothetical protein